MLSVFNNIKYDQANHIFISIIITVNYINDFNYFTLIIFREFFMQDCELDKGHYTLSI